MAHHLSRQLRKFDNPKTGGDICAVYEDAIEFSNNSGFMRGAITAFGGLMLMMFLWTTAFSVWSLIDINGDFFFGFFLLFIFEMAAILVTISGMRTELFNGYSDRIVFNRVKQTVSIFKRRHRWLRPFSRHEPLVVTTTWQGVGAEITRGGSGSLNVPQVRCILNLVLYASAQDHSKVDSVQLGVWSIGMEACEQKWEFICRYMAGEGVSCHEEESIMHEDLSTPWAAFKSSLWPADKQARDINMIIFPLAVLIALACALIVFVGRAPKFAPEVEQSLGPLLNEEQARAQVVQERLRLANGESLLA